jgi:hypothetical protein
MKVYIATAANFYGGGPTALFQLCSALRLHGVDSYITFYRLEPYKNPVHDNYKQFQNPWIPIDKVYDDSNNIIIVGEADTSRLIKFKKIKKIVYWLSVDNYFISKYLLKEDAKLRLLKFITFVFSNYFPDFINLNTRIIRNRSLKFYWNFFHPQNNYIRLYWNAYYPNYVKKLIETGEVKIPKADLYIAQSNYSRIFLEKQGVSKNNIVLINEPIEKEFLSLGRNLNLDRKKEWIAWNFTKSYPMAYKLISLLKRKFKVVPLHNAGRRKMIDTLSYSKIFIDIGYHPGRDRVFREAIALGCLAVVNNYGGYHLKEDCPVPAKFKINYEFDNYLLNSHLRELYKNIIMWIDNYDSYIREFDDIRKNIFSEPELFAKQVKTLVSQIERL